MGLKSPGFYFSLDSGLAKATLTEPYDSEGLLYESHLLPWPSEMQMGPQSIDWTASVDTGQNLPAQISVKCNSDKLDNFWPLGCVLSSSGCERNIHIYWVERGFYYRGHWRGGVEEVNKWLTDVLEDDHKGITIVSLISGRSLTHTPVYFALHYQEIKAACNNRFIDVSSPLTQSVEVKLSDVSVGTSRRNWCHVRL